MRAPDPAFADPRLAVLYDALDDDRSDLDHYAAIAEEVGASFVVDVGCGTGSLAVRLAEAGLTVTGVDPALASLEVARGKPYADRVTWIHGDATDLPTGSAADLAVMTGNVAQVFVDDSDWHATLDAILQSLRPGGWLVFETRRPEARAWEEWDIAPTEVSVPSGPITVRRQVTDATLPLVTFKATTTLGLQVLESTSTLRFRERADLERDLTTHGYDIVEIRDAPDRPGKEWVFLCQAK